MKTIIALLLVFVTFTTKTFAQEEISLIRPKSFFSVGLLNNLSQTHYDTDLGTIDQSKRFALGQLLQFKYRYNFNPKFYAEASWGFGTQVENRTSVVRPSEGFKFYNYNVFWHSRIEMSCAYILAQHGKNRLNAKLGLGWNKFASWYLESSSVDWQGDKYHMTMITREKRLPFATLGLEYCVPTKRFDEVSFYLGYQQGFISYVRGDFNYIQGGSEAIRGSIHNSLSALQIGITYSFTRIKKVQHIEAISRAQNIERRSAKKINRTERRIIDPKSQFISAGFGFGIGNNKFRPKNSPLKSPTFPSFMTRFAYEWGYKNNLFFDVDYFGFQFWQGEKIFIPYVGNSTFASDAFYGHFLNFGAQYKIQNRRTNFQFFNIHAGVGLGAHFLPKDDFSGGSGSGIVGDYSYEHEHTSEVRGNLMPIIYGGISKDIRISEKLLLNFTYRHQLGFVNVYNSEYTFLDSNDSQPRTINSKINGSAFFLQMGFKYRLR